MKLQLSFASSEYGRKKRVTRREEFLSEMERLVPWSRWVALIESLYPKNGRVGRPPIGLENMLRMYCVQHWFDLSDEGVEDALYGSQALRRFVGIDLSCESPPDATTLLKFGRLQEDNKLTAAMFEEVKALLSEKDLLTRKSSMVDATTIAAPPSTKNKDKAREPEMHQAKPGKQSHFGMKAHIGPGAQAGQVHSLHVTAANESDVAHTHKLLHGQVSQAQLDAGYSGVQKREEVIQVQAEGRFAKDIVWNVATRRSKIKAMPDGSLKDLLIAAKPVKAQIRARVDHPFHGLKNLFHHKKARYKSLTKNEAQLYSLFGLVNFVIARPKLWVLDARGTS